VIEQAFKDTDDIPYKRTPKPAARWNPLPHSLADGTGMSVLGLIHFNKGGSSDVLNNVKASRAFTGPLPAQSRP
jgi:hypothetical protein